MLYGESKSISAGNVSNDSVCERIADVRVRNAVLVASMGVFLVYSFEMSLFRGFVECYR